MESTKPVRITVNDFAGRKLTLGDSPEYWEAISGTDRENLLVLGLGPGDPANLPFVSDSSWKKIFWFDEPDFLNAMNEKQPGRLAKFINLGAKRVTLAELSGLAPVSRIFFYRPAMRMFPAFWGEILAQVEIASQNKPQVPPLSGAKSSKLAWLPGNESQLLHRELRFALLKSGYEKIGEAAPKAPTAASLENLWNGALPDIAVSVNFRGLDGEGRIYNLCNALGVPLAIWLVDNPWLLLTSIKLPWWKKADIFVTDPSFIKPLQESGAKKVFFCPLAAAWHMWREAGTAEDSPLFIGRSAFPGQSAFFSGIKLDNALYNKANSMLANPAESGLPDFHWWEKAYGNSPWPGNSVRKAGFGADMFSTLNKFRWLKAGLVHNLHITGDDGWKKFLPEAEILPPVDYYGKVPSLYSRAECVLNVTSLLLPQSLNQRHFDVWAAGGLLLTDATNGLDIFPGDLTSPVTMREPGELGERLSYFRNHSAFRRELTEAWRQELARKHSYTMRVSLMEQHIKKGATMGAF